MLTLRIAHLIAKRSIPIRSAQVLYFSDDKKKHTTEKSDKEKQHEDKSEAKTESASERLNKLLSSMQKDEGITKIKTVQVTTASGKKHRQEKIKMKSKKEEKPKDIFEAAKSVADLMGDEKKKTESELLSKLLGHIDKTAPVSGEKDVSTDDGKELNLRDVIVGMKIDRTPPGQKTDQTRGQYVRKAIEDRQSKGQQQIWRNKKDKTLSEPHPSTGSVNLFGSQPLGIFKSKDELTPSPDILKTWKYLHERELKLSVTHPPANYFQKMILWTEQGKVWKFPIDNEQGLDEEAKVDFSEHVFTEQYLEGWCPDKGPIRHFMELVCVGLSKNPYITAQEKKEHILWYRDYFEQKKDILKELIIQKQEGKAKQKSVESK